MRPRSGTFAIWRLRCAFTAKSSKGLLSIGVAFAVVARATLGLPGRGADNVPKGGVVGGFQLSGSSPFDLGNCGSEDSQLHLLARRSEVWKWHTFPYRVPGRARQLCPGSSDVDFLRDVECIVDLHTEISYCAFDLGVPEEELNGPQVARPPGDQRGLGSAHGMRRVYYR